MLTATDMRAESRAAAKIPSLEAELGRICRLMKKQAAIGDNHCRITIDRIADEHVEREVIETLQRLGYAISYVCDNRQEVINGAKPINKKMNISW